MIGADDTIAAIASAAGPAGVGVIRLSGPAAAGVLSTLSGRSPGAFVDRRLTRVVLRDRTGARLDDALCVVMRAPRSFTGEDVVEIHGHGGARNLGRLLAATLAAGARLATPGEFSRRALVAGKLDLVQAEAMLAVIEAGSERALRVAQDQLAGALGAALTRVEVSVTAALAELEAAIDFPEEGLALAGPGAVVAGLEAAATTCRDLAATHGLGRALSTGVEVALRGAVNAGKSSLLNALVGEERALVAPEPGTTRDYLEVRTVWDGVPVTLIDTAGERVAEAAVERRGIALGAERAARADVELWLVAPLPGDSMAAGAAAHEAAAPAPAVGAAPVDGGRVVVVTSKVDLVPGGAGGAEGALACSAHSGVGLDRVRRAVLARAIGRGAMDAEAGDDAIVTTERQRRELDRAAEALAAAAAAARAGRPEELVALDVRAGAEALAAVRGHGVGESVLDALFARFCIGK